MPSYLDALRAREKRLTDDIATLTTLRDDVREEIRGESARSVRGSGRMAQAQPVIPTRQGKAPTHSPEFYAAARAADHTLTSLAKALGIGVGTLSNYVQKTRATPPAVAKKIERLIGLPASFWGV